MVGDFDQNQEQNTLASSGVRRVQGYQMISRKSCGPGRIGERVQWRQFKFRGQTVMSSLTAYCATEENRSDLRTPSSYRRCRWELCEEKEKKLEAESFRFLK